jgi:hypothetical protein
MDILQSAFAAGIVVNALFTVFLLSRVKYVEAVVQHLRDGFVLQDVLNNDLGMFVRVSASKMDELSKGLESLESTVKCGSTNTE